MSVPIWDSYVLQEINEGICGLCIGFRALVAQAIQAGFY
jgi:hypothetical protein